MTVVKCCIIISTWLRLIAAHVCVEHCFIHVCCNYIAIILSLAVLMMC